MLFIAFIIPECLARLVEFIMMRFGWSFQTTIIVLIVNLVSVLGLIALCVSEKMDEYKKRREEINELIESENLLNDHNN